MSYESEVGEVSAVWRPSAEIERLVRPTSSVAFTAPGSITRGQYGLFRWEMKPNAGGPNPHFHKTFSEAFYILNGSVRLFNGRDWVEAHAGDFLFVPEGGIHAFANQTDTPASMLILFAPGAPREEYFKELAEIGNSGRQLSPEEWTELYRRHDQYMVD
jgi:quercetin dioxygenase-like cupin family protein